MTAAGCTPSPAAGATGPDGSAGGWSTARLVSALANVGRYIYPNDPEGARWCGSPGNCAIGYATGNPASSSFAQSRSFVASETDGSWHAPQAIADPGSVTDALSLSCSGPGNCAAGMAAAGPREQPAEALVATQRNGAWGAARPVPGLSSLKGSAGSAVTALSCSAAGWCALAGAYWPKGGDEYGKFVQPFVATGHDGAWSRAQPIRGLRALSQGLASSITAISCDPSGSCTAAGSYRSRPAGSREHAFVVTEVNGTWGSVQPIPDGTAITYISCTAPGDCTAAGNRGSTGIFVVTERSGRWGAPEVPPGIRPDSAVTTAQLTGLSCSAPGHCVVAGFYGTSGNACGGDYDFCYEGAYSATVPFTVSQANGTWGTASQVPGVKALNRGRIAVITSLSCNVGVCAAGGITAGIGNGASTGIDTVPVRAFVVYDTGGTWNQAVRVPGLAGVSSPRSEIDLITCGPSGKGASSCTAIGDYQIRRGSPRDRMFMTVHAGSAR
jgi:hypothetical protein